MGDEDDTIELAGHRTILETSILSVLASHPHAFDLVSDQLDAKHFASDLHRRMFVEIARQTNAGIGCDAITLFEGMGSKDDLKHIHAILISHDSSSRSIVKLVDQLIERYKLSELSRIGIDIHVMVHNTEKTAQEKIDLVSAELTSLSDEGPADEWVGAEESAINHLDVIERRDQGLLAGLPTGLIDFDELLDGGMQRGSLVILGARPSMGKTAMAMTIARHMAQDHWVAFHSMEMPHADLRDRLYAMLGRVSLSSIKRPQAGHGLDWSKVLSAVEDYKRLRLQVNDRPALNILQVRSKARSLKRKTGLDILMVDYLGLMSGLDRKQSRAYQIEEITKGLKALAKELDIVVVALAQLNRDVAERAGQVPVLSDLRDSGAIEQDADVVGFIHRPIVAKPDIGDEWAGYALLRVAKNRQGRCGDVHLNYLGDLTLFESGGVQPQKSESQSRKQRGME